jgi:hypothetical protein|tara:strand:+ start:21 stop:314 length:294 start_codon:yes stop_codon:yes gene_type:complete
MAIIRYNLTSNVNGTTPSYITDGGYFKNRADDTRIGVGSGGGTTIANKADLITYVLSIHANYPFKKWADDSHVNQENKTDSEVTAIVNNWCTARGIS